MIFNQPISLCEICGTKFQPSKGRRNVNRFCSIQCVGQNLRNKAQSKYNLNPKHCLNCEDIIPYDKKSNKFCCQSCAAIFNNQGVRRHGNPRGTCKICGNIKGSYSRRFCSKECQAIGQTKYTEEEKIKVSKIRNKIAQSKWRAKGWRKLDPNSDPKRIREIYENCPEGYEVDHILPLSLGGKHHEDNLQYLPKELNRKKGNRWIG